MRYPKEYKESARQRLVAAGASHAKRHGFGDSGMADLAAAAGVTTGSLYKHFDGKADLFASLIAAELHGTAQRYDAIDPTDRAAAVRSMNAYLSLEHVREPEQGCLLPSLTPEVARADASVRAVFQKGMQEVHASLEKLTGSADGAWALIAQNVGAIMIARALPDEESQRQLLAALRRSAQRLLNDASDAHAGQPTEKPRF